MRAEHLHGLHGPQLHARQRVQHQFDDERHQHDREREIVRIAVKEIQQPMERVDDRAQRRAEKLKHLPLLLIPGGAGVRAPGHSRRDAGDDIATTASASATRPSTFRDGQSPPPRTPNRTARTCTTAPGTARSTADQKRITATPHTRAAGAITRSGTAASRSRTASPSPPRSPRTSQPAPWTVPPRQSLPDQKGGSAAAQTPRATSAWPGFAEPPLPPCAPLSRQRARVRRPLARIAPGSRPKTDVPPDRLAQNRPGS